MDDRSCDCADELVDDRSNTTKPTGEPLTERWIPDPTPSTPLPADVSTEFERFLDTAPIETIGTLQTAFERSLPLDRETLCYADEPTPHRGVLDGDAYYFQCFFDAILLAELADTPVDIRTETPTGTVMQIRATGDGTATTTPETAALSFGIRTDRVTTAEPSFEAAYQGICPAVTAFENRAAYEQWASEIPAATIGVPVSAATTLAARIVRR